MRTKSARLDQILMSLGLVDEDQVRRALRRQQVEGGRFGQNLVALGSITERQLLLALAEQYNLTLVDLDEATVPVEVARRMPPEVVRSGQAIPLELDEGRGVVTLAVAHPADDALVERVKRALDVRTVRLRIAPDGAMAALGRRLGRILDGVEAAPADDGVAAGDPAGSGIALPELFGGAGPGDEAAPDPEAPHRIVVLVTSRASLRNFLPPILERDGTTLIPAGDAEEVKAALSRSDVEAVLVSDEMRETLSAWIRGGVVPRPAAEVVSFGSVGETLLANPVPYSATVGSLKRAVEALADARSARFQAAIPYGLVASDAAALGRRVGLSRVAVDALHLAAHLLLPAPFEPASGSIRWEHPFDDFASSLELARRIRFPWRLDGLVMAVYDLFVRRGRPDRHAGAPGVGVPAPDADARTGDPETLLAARVLAVAWYRNLCVLRTPDGSEEALIALRATLRSEMTPVATSAVVEAYLDIVQERGGPRGGGDDAKVLLVGGERLERALAPSLGRVGRESFTTDTLAEAQALMERHMPAALVIDGAEFPREVEKFSRVTKLDGSALIFVLTDVADPAIAMSLLEVGIDDVFTPPHDYDLIAARVNRAVRSRARTSGRDDPVAGQFSSDFEVFSFLDLVQMLSQGLKTVRIDLTRDDAQSAVLYMVNGRIVHASSGDLLGTEAVYEVIRWEDEGEFTVRQEDPARFPEATIALATDSLLMEGVRLLDESKR